jgi:hypothetical protein
MMARNNKKYNKILQKIKRKNIGRKILKCEHLLGPSETCATAWYLGFGSNSLLTSGCFPFLKYTSQTQRQYIGVYICAYICVYIYIYMYVYKHIYVYVHIYVSIYVYMCINIHTYVCIYTYICMYIYIYMYVYIHKYIYIYIYLNGFYYPPPNKTGH